MKQCLCTTLPPRVVSRVEILRVEFLHVELLRVDHLRHMYERSCVALLPENNLFIW